MLWFNFIFGLNFIFFLFLGMVIYDNEGDKKQRKKMNQNIYSL